MVRSKSLTALPPLTDDLDTTGIHEKRKEKEIFYFFHHLDRSRSDEEVVDGTTCGRSARRKFVLEAREKGTKMLLSGISDHT